MKSLQFEILMDRFENPRKCTILPQKERPDFHIRYFRGQAPIAAFQSQYLLHVEGDDLATIKNHLAKEAASSIALIDCNWRKVQGALARVMPPMPKLVKIPDGFQTAYPRRNKEGKDPEAGLATIEALFIAAAFFGHWDESLLDKYHFKNDFLRINEAQWSKYGLKANR